MNSDSLNMVSRLGEGHMPCTFFLSEPQLKTTVIYAREFLVTRFFKDENACNAGNRFSIRAGLL